MKIVLRPAQVGPGYRLHVRPDTFGARGFVTLDLCGFDFPSESLRTNRIQVDYTHRGAAVRLSNEVVSYTPGGARQALREVTRAALRCPTGPQPSHVQGVPPLTYRVTSINARGLVEPNVALRVRVTGSVKGKRMTDTSIAVYQVRGNVLSAVYAHAGTLRARTLSCLHAARQSAENLRRHA